MPGTPPPRADVEHAQVRALRQVRHHGERVEQVVRDHALRLADRRQVVGAVPLREQREVRAQLRALRRRHRDAERRDAARERVVLRGDGGRHARSGASPARHAMRLAAARQVAAALQVHEQQRDRRRRDARDARRLPDRFGPAGGELLAHLGRQAAHVGVVEVRRQAQRFLRERARDLVVLAVDVARVLGRRSRPARRPAGRRPASRRPAASSGARRSRPGGAAGRRAHTLARALAPERASAIALRRRSAD